VVSSRATVALFLGTTLLSQNLQLDRQGHLYEQLARALKRAILNGQLAAGQKLPATRTLALALGMSRNSAISAYDLLCTEQLATARGGSGTRVSSIVLPRIETLSRPRAQPPSRYAARSRALAPSALSGRQPKPHYDLLYGEPLIRPTMFRSWRRRLAAAALRAGPGYPVAGGFPPLRRAICDYLARRRGIACNEKDVLIVSGTQQALTLTARVVLNEGDVAVIEEPHYQYLMQGLLAHGARVRSAPTDSEGLMTSELAKHRARLVCVTPSHQFPAGTTLSLERRLKLLQIASTQNSWVFEDDYDSEFQYHGRLIPALRSLDLADRVLYVGTFSKTLFPSLRLGYIVCPTELRDDLFKAKHLDDLGCPAIDQAALAVLMQGRNFEKHLRESVAELRRRRCALFEGLTRHARDHVDFTDSHAGVHVVVWLRHLSYDQLFHLIDIAKSRELGLYPIHPHYKKRPARPGLLIGYAGLTPAALAIATNIFGQCLKDVMAESNPKLSKRGSSQFSCTNTR
jgi:GntR family transcriptional regulator/MocR family aminotransferase